MIKLTQKQQDLLKSVGRNPKDPDFGKPNPALNQMVSRVRNENPNATRCF